MSEPALITLISCFVGVAIISAWTVLIFRSVKPKPTPPKLRVDSINIYTGRVPTSKEFTVGLETNVSTCVLTADQAETLAASLSLAASSARLRTAQRNAELN